MSPARLRQLLVGRGPVGVKIGQFLAVRPDLIPQEYADELLTLVDQAPPSPWGETRRVLTADLGQPLDAAFPWINTTPFAAGSLAQVYAGVAHDGTQLAVKVQRPGAAEEIRREIRRARWLARLLDAAGVLRVISSREAVDEFERWLAQELDFSAEVHNQMRMAALNRGDVRALVPMPFRELSGPRVLASELVPGVPFSELLRLRRDARGDDGIRDLELDPGRLADNLLTTVLRQIFVDRVFHADPHPGNLLALPGDVVCFVDFGLVDDLDETVRRGLDEYIGSVYAGDVERMFRGARELFVATERTDMERFHHDFVAATQRWMQERVRATEQRRPHERTPLAGYLIAVLSAARDNHLRVPPRILSIYRTLLTAETVAGHLGADIDLDGVGRRFFARLRVQRAIETLDLDTAVAHGAAVLNLLQEAPGALNRVLGDLADERFVLPVRTQESSVDMRQASLRARLVATALLILATTVLVLAATLRWGDGATAALVALLSLLVGYLLILWRRLT